MADRSGRLGCDKSVPRLYERSPPLGLGSSMLPVVKAVCPKLGLVGVKGPVLDVLDCVTGANAILCSYAGVCTFENVDACFGKVSARR